MVAHQCSAGRAIVVHGTPRLETVLLRKARSSRTWIGMA